MTGGKEGPENEKKKLKYRDMACLRLDLDPWRCFSLAKQSESIDKLDEPLKTRPPMAPDLDSIGADRDFTMTAQNNSSCPTGNEVIDGSYIVFSIQIVVYLRQSSI